MLDVGCVPGHLTAYLRSVDVDATGIDLVPDLIDHARITFPDGRYELGSMLWLPVPDHSVAGTLVAGFFGGDDVAAFEHKVTMAYYWPWRQASNWTIVRDSRLPPASVTFWMN